MTLHAHGFYRWRKSGSSRSDFFAVLLVITFATVGGCSPRVEHGGAVMSSNAEATEGLAALEKKDWKAANEHLTKALKGSGLRTDLYEEVLLGHARSCIETEDYTTATNDLLLLEFNAANLEPVWLLKCDLAMRQNDMITAASAFAQAKKINPKLAKPKGLE